jgi:hypothetical protein
MSVFADEDRIYPAEIIPLYIRSKSVSLATFFNWSMNFALTFFSPPAFRNIQWRVSGVTMVLGSRTDASRHIVSLAHSAWLH